MMRTREAGSQRRSNSAALAPEKAPPMITTSYWVRSGAFGEA